MNKKLIKGKIKIFALTALVALTLTQYVFAATWIEQTGSSERQWRAITSSDDGVNLAALVNGDYIYTSTDSGVTWTERTASGQRSWQDIVSSNDGVKLAAAEYGGLIYTSIDSGATWTGQASSTVRSWMSIASSDDGTKLVVAADSDYIYTSTDSGVTWTERTASGVRTWFSVASSADGTKLVASATNGYIYTSTDSGVTWTERTSSGARIWREVASSNDGTKLVAVAQTDVDEFDNTISGYIYTSADSGATWTERTDAGQREWSLLTTSNDGSIIVTTADGESVWVSFDSGVTWAEQTSLGSNSWIGLTSSADGLKVAVTTNGSYIYTTTLPTVVPAPTITFPVTGSNITTWAPSVNWDGANPCEYSFDNSTYTSSTCSENGANILTPPATGSQTLYVRGTNEIGLGSASATFTYQGPIWTRIDSTGPSGGWKRITMSSNGVKMAAIGSNKIFTSTNSGVSWTEQTSAGTRAWDDITSSSDGTKLAATVTNGYIYTSTDSGVTWTERTGAGIHLWRDITSSSDGTKLAATASEGRIHTSTDSGVTWTAQLGSREFGQWSGIASSADGTFLIASEFRADDLDPDSGYVYTSTDSGVTWTTQTAAGKLNFTEIAVSSDGTKVIGAESGGYVYTSTDSGVTWTQQTGSGQRHRRAVASSADGTRLAVVGGSTHVYTSDDSGVTWTTQIGSGARSWLDIASTADGLNLAAVENYIYLGTLPSPASTPVPVAATSVATGGMVPLFFLSGGCTDLKATNFNSQASMNNGSCVYATQVSNGGTNQTIGGGSRFQFNRNLGIAMRDADVLELQKYLNTKGFQIAATGPGSKGKETNYYGALTRAAVLRFQNAHAAEILVPAGLARGTGYFGPATRAFVNTDIVK